MSLLDEYKKGKQRDSADILRILSYVEQIQQPGNDYRLDNDQLLKIAFSILEDAEKTISRQKAQIEHLKQLSTTDEDTGLLNKRGFSQALRRALAHARRYDQEGVVVLCDLDHFKRINDTHGHLAGDHVLAEIAKMLHTSLRQTDVVGRIGGDEFALLLTGTTPARAKQRLRDVQDQIEASPVLWQGERLSVTFSMGMTRFSSESEEDSLIEKADQALYRSKRRKMQAQGLTLIKK